ncbi:hypothetical protein DFH08DRAFT_909722 [Mycena albidolilacea]|uniref:Uncharacterized protein n=1 Tax=Mycena albidolilacea TaxID=1033008 RepID=A0AAD7ARY2_9AGAR|nr:hypothetical protein DFH08DRAFT_909722 [Mycena albidolilacea]
MCINSCTGYTGPFSQCDNCPYCSKSRYEPDHPPEVRIPCQWFSTFPLAPQLQALWWTPEGTNSLKYCQCCTAKIMEELARNNGICTSPYVDFFDGSDYPTAIQEGRISIDNMVLAFSIDGEQLYHNKVSECWIYIWIILGHAPSVHYKKNYVLPGRIIGRPGKPKNPESYVFPGFHHRDFGFGTQHSIMYSHLGHSLLWEQQMVQEWPR